MMSDRHFQWNGIRLRAPEPEDLEVMFRFENATDVWEMSNTTCCHFCCTNNAPMQNRNIKNMPPNNHRER